MRVFTKITFIFFAFMLLACGKESRMIKGAVTDQSQQPLQDVLVQVVGTDLYAKTKADGTFFINTKKRGNELLFNLKGYKLYFHKLNKDTSPLDIKLQKK
ncbi:MAG: carboxypeptidase-like regulatory domain-containing protein [Flavobacteriaceae bacterium]|nr:carboxypeptidase-like regulatory domain-containing protein [Psychroflexus sp.]